MTLSYNEEVGPTFRTFKAGFSKKLVKQNPERVSRVVTCTLSHNTLVAMTSPLPSNMCRLSYTMTSDEWVSEASRLLSDDNLPDSVKRQVRRLWVARLQETGIVRGTPSPEVEFVEPADKSFTPENKYTALALQSFDPDELLRLAARYLVPGTKIEHVEEPARTRHGAPTSQTTHTCTAAPIYKYSG